MCTMSSNEIVLNGNIGIQNSSPWAPLNIGNCDVSGFDGYINFAIYNSMSSSYRNCRVGLMIFLAFQSVIMEILTTILILGQFSLQFFIMHLLAHLVLMRQEKF